MPTAYSYIRFSTLDQLKGDSLRRQLEASTKYALEHNLTLDETLNVRDIGISAFKGSNVETGALGQFIVAIDEGRVPRDSFLLVESLDRLSRLPVTDAYKVFESIIDRGITIVTMTDNAIYSKQRLKNDWTPLMIALISMSRAHEESAVKSRRVKAAWDAKKERVKATKEVMSGRCPWWLRLSSDQKKYEIIEENAEVVRLMFNLAKDGLGNSLIAKYLNERNIPTAQHAARWQVSTTQFNLRNIATIGVLQLDQDNNGRTTTDTFVTDYYPPIVDKSLFYEVQAIRNERNRNQNATSAGRKSQCHNIFQGIVKCGYCGSSMYLRRNSRVNSSFLYCAKSLQGGGCIGVSYNLRDLQSEFLSFAKELDLAQVLGNSSTSDILSNKRKELAVCSGEIQALQIKLNNLVTAIEAGADMELVVQRMRSQQGQLNELKKRQLFLLTEIETLSTNDIRDQFFLNNLTELMARLESKDTTHDEKYRLRFRLFTEIQKLFKQLTLFPGGIVPNTYELSLLVDKLKGFGWERNKIDAYISATIQTKPDREERFFAAYLRNGVIRYFMNGHITETGPTV